MMLALKAGRLTAFIARWLFNEMSLRISFPGKGHIPIMQHCSVLYHTHLISTKRSSGKTDMELMIAVLLAVLNQMLFKHTGVAC